MELVFVGEADERRGIDDIRVGLALAQTLNLALLRVEADARELVAEQAPQTVDPARAANVEHDERSARKDVLRDKRAQHERMMVANSMTSLGQPGGDASATSTRDVMTALRPCGNISRSGNS